MTSLLDIHSQAARSANALDPRYAVAGLVVSRASSYVTGLQSSSVYVCPGMRSVSDTLTLAKEEVSTSLSIDRACVRDARREVVPWMAGCRRSAWLSLASRRKG